MAMVVGASSPDRWRHNERWSPAPIDPAVHALGEWCRFGLAPALRRSSSVGRVRGGGAPTGSLRSRGCCGWGGTPDWSRVLRPATGASVEMTTLLGLPECCIRRASVASVTVASSGDDSALLHSVRPLHLLKHATRTASRGPSAANLVVRASHPLPAPMALQIRWPPISCSRCRGFVQQSETLRCGQDAHTSVELYGGVLATIGVARWVRPAAASEQSLSEDDARPREVGRILGAVAVDVHELTRRGR